MQVQKIEQSLTGDVVFTGEFSMATMSSVSVAIVPPVQCLAGGEPGLQPNRGCVLLYTTRHGNTRAPHQW